MQEEFTMDFKSLSFPFIISFGWVPSANELLEGSARGLFSALQTNSTLLLLDTQGELHIRIDTFVRMRMHQTTISSFMLLNRERAVKFYL